MAPFPLLCHFIFFLDRSWARSGRLIEPNLCAGSPDAADPTKVASLQCHQVRRSVSSERQTTMSPESQIVLLCTAYPRRINAGLRGNAFGLQNHSKILQTHVVSLAGHTIGCHESLIGARGCDFIFSTEYGHWLISVCM